MAPSRQLRQWFAHDPAKWKEFKGRYMKELKSNTATMEDLKKTIKDHPVITFLYAAKDDSHNNALVLKEYVSNVKDVVLLSRF